MATHVNPDSILSPARIPIDGMPIFPPEDLPKPMPKPMPKLPPEDLPKLPPECLPKLPPEDLIPLPDPILSPAFYFNVMMPPIGPLPIPPDPPKPFRPCGSEEAGLLAETESPLSTEVAPVSGDNESVFSEVASESAPDAFEIGDLLIEGLQVFLA